MGHAGRRVRVCACVFNQTPNPKTNSAARLYNMKCQAIEDQWAELSCFPLPAHPPPPAFLGRLRRKDEGGEPQGGSQEEAGMRVLGGRKQREQEEGPLWATLCSVSLWA